MLFIWLRLLLVGYSSGLVTEWGLSDDFDAYDGAAASLTDHA